MTQLDGFRVVIIGATSGLGAAMATAIAEAGARMMVTGASFVACPHRTVHQLPR